MTYLPLFSQTLKTFKSVIHKHPVLGFIFTFLHTEFIGMARWHWKWKLILKSESNNCNWSERSKNTHWIWVQHRETRQSWRCHRWIWQWRGRRRASPWCAPSPRGERIRASWDHCATGSYSPWSHTSSWSSSWRSLILVPQSETPVSFSSSWSCCKSPGASLSRMGGILSASQTWWPLATTSHSSCRSQSGETPRGRCSLESPQWSTPMPSSCSSTSQVFSWSPSDCWRSRMAWLGRGLCKTPCGEISSVQCTVQSRRASHVRGSQGEGCQA